MGVERKINYWTYDPVSSVKDTFGAGHNQHNGYDSLGTVLNQRKKFRSSVIVRNIYTEVLNILQAVVMKKLSKKGIQKKHRKYLDDAMMTSIAGIAAAMKNSG